MGATILYDGGISGPITTSMVPSADATYDLGSSALEWRDLYLSRNLVFGTDVTLRRSTTSSLILGAADSASPLSYTLRGGESSRAATDTNVAGGSFTITSAPGTGTGAVSSIIFQTPTVAASGSSAQALATRLTINSAGIIIAGGTFFTGVMSGTVSGRWFFQNSTANTSTSLGVMPSGNGTNATVTLFNTTNTTNFAFADFGIGNISGYVALDSNKGGSGTTLPIGFAINGTIQVAVTTGASLNLTTGVIGFGSATSPDAGISRLGAASFALGNGTASDFAGALKLTTLNAVGAITLQTTAANTSLVVTATSDSPTTTYTAHVASTDPAGYLKILVGASARYIPFFT